MNILITLDYELHLGESTGTVTDSLIVPMQEFTGMLDTFNIKVSLFVDASYILRLLKLKDSFSELEDDFNLIISHLKQLAGAGHNLQLHLHPQWYYSIFNGAKWELDLDHYKLSDMVDCNVPEYFREAKVLLESVSGKKITAFRAGGYSLQTLTNHYNLLLSNDILIDSSVVPGKMKKSRQQCYDYRNVPRAVYKFKDRVTHPDVSGRIWEIPVSTVSMNPLEYSILRQKAEKECTFRPFSSGHGIPEPSHIRGWNILKQFLHKKVVSASADGFSSFLLPNIFEKYQSDASDDCFVILGHPKNFSPQSVKCMENFIGNTRRYHKYHTVEELQQKLTLS